MADSVIVVVLKSADLGDSTTAETPTQLLVRVNDLIVDSVGIGTARARFALHPMSLADRTVSLWRPDARAPLCLGVPLPRVVSRTFEAYRSRTDFTASGEVNDALNSGAASGAAAGSLGIHHTSYAVEARDTVGFLDPLNIIVRPVLYLGARIFAARNAVRRKRLQDFRLRGWSIGIEEVRATISAAGTADSLTNTSGGDFAEAVLVPITATSGKGSSVRLEYSPLHAYGDSHQRIGLVGRFVASRSRWSPDNQVSQRVGKFTTVIALEERIRWMPINHESPTDGNSFSLSLELGPIQRYIMGDGARKVVLPGDTMTFVQRALGQRRTRFAGYATGLFLTLRQVTAFADLACLSCDLPGVRRSRIAAQDRIEGLEGFQPTIGFRFEAPFFTLTGRP